jgi:hypothetical protein
LKLGRRFYMQQTATIEQNRRVGYERYEAYQRFEEATDIAERIGYPIDHTVHYEMRDGLAYGVFDKQNRPFRELTDEARREGHKIFTGINRFEAIRREHEHQEALLVDRFGRGELNGTVLVKISPVPDAVRDGTADIDGYRRDLLRSFVRIYYEVEDGVRCRLFSLDMSDRSGLAAVGDLLGITTDGRSSEDILGDHALVDMGENISDESVTELVGHAKFVYDKALKLQTGEQFHAGSRMLNKNDALSLVMRHDSLLDEHMKEISSIMSRALDPDAKKALLETRRKRTAAAMDIVEQGGVVGSSNDSTVTEQMSAKDYGGECATGNAANAVGMAQGAKKERELKKGTCQACLRKGTVGECSVCLDCEEDDNKGVDLMKVRAKAFAALAARQAQQASRLKPEKSLSKIDQIKAKYGRYAEERKGSMRFGYQTRVIVDRRNGRMIDEY